MSRPARGSSEETFDRIVTAAKELVKERGASHLSLRGLASKTGLSLGTIQYYFPSREALIDHCVAVDDRRVDDYFAAARQAIADGTPIADVAANIVRLAFGAGERHRETLRLRILAVLEGPEPTTDAQSRIMLVQLRRSAALLAEASGMDILEARLLVQSISMLVGRYSVFTPEELSRISGAETSQAATDLTADHLATMTRDLIVAGQNRSRK